MSLFDKITQSFSQVTDLFSKPDTGTNSGLSETKKTAPTSFWTNLFGKNTSTPSFNQDAGLRLTAQNINLSNEDIKAQTAREAARLNLSAPQQDGGYIQVPVVLPNNYPTPEQESRAILTGLRFKDSDIRAYNEHYQTDLVKDLSVGLGKNVDHNAGQRVYISGEKRDVYTGYIAIDGKTHKNLKDFLAARRTGGELPATGINNAKAINKPANLKLDPVTVTVLAGGGAAVGGVLVETMSPQISTDIVPRAMETLGKVTSVVAEVAPPLTMIAAEAAPTVFIADHLAQNYAEGKDQFERGQAASEYDLARDLAKATSLTMTMEEAEPFPQTVPQSKPNERPFAEPPAKPKVTDLPNAPTDIIPAPKSKPETTIEDLPQPVTPDVPQGTPPPSPKSEPPTNPKDILPPIIGAVTAAAGKAAADAVKTENQSTLPPDLVKIRASLKDFLAQKSFDQRYAQIQPDAQMTDTNKVAKFNGYLESAKQLGDGDLEQGLIKDLQEYTFRRGLNLPYGTENRITFAEFGKQVREGFNKAGIKDVQAYIQGSAITGVKYTTGKIFDVGRPSDWDMAVASPKLFTKAKELGVEIRGKGTRTEPLDTKQLERLGLLELAEQLEKTTGREIGIMIYKTQQDAKDRNPNSIYVP